MLRRMAGRFCALVCVTGSIWFSGTALAEAAAPHPLLIGEVGWAGSSRSTADEWLELWNRSDQPLDLTGYKLTGAGGTKDIVFDKTAVIPPLSAFLVANHPASDTKSTLAVDPQVVTSTLSLPNDKLLIKLFDADGQLVDQAGDGGLPPAGISSSTKASMVRLQDGAWKTADERQHFDEGVADFGTPGFCDGCSWIDAAATSSRPSETSGGNPLESDPSTALGMTTTTTAATTTTVITTTAATTTEIMPEVVLSPTTTIELPVQQPVSVPEIVPEIVIIPTPTETTVQETTTTSGGNPLESDPSTALGMTEVTTSTTGTVELPVEQPAVIPPPSEPTPATIIQEIQLPDIRLAKIFPAPSSGKEWMELSLPEGVATDAVNGWLLYDAAGKILTINTSSSRIELASARLNNGGDAVELHRPDGTIAERMTYTTTPHDAYWVKNANQSAWVMIDPKAEPPAPVETPEPEIVTTYAQSPPTIELPLMEATGDGETGSLRTNQGSDFAEGVEPAGPVAVAKKVTKIKSSTAPKIPKPKTTAVKKSIPADRVITFDMLTKIEPNVRVVITGMVATQPGILNKNQYVLLSADGHGLLVYGTSKQPSPQLGKTVRVAGMLELNDDGLSLHLATKDRWMEIKTTGTPQPRVVDFLSGSLDDGWSLVDVTATVGEVKNSGVALDLGDITAVLHAKPVSGYRLSRIKQGDTIRVKALVDLRGLDPILVVRSADDVDILSHAALAKVGTAAPQGLPDWTPFGAAGITVAITQGFKKLKKLRDEKQVEKLIAQATS